MRKFVVVFFVLALMSGGVSATAYPTNCFKERETSINKTGDWFAALGKNGMEKKRILAKRRHDRVMDCARKKIESGPRGKQPRRG
ncbi:MAG: hypothetical protein V1673_02770 [Candidatus Omnitrophota bacterium]